MSLDFISEVYDALKTHIQKADQSDAAESLVNLLVDNGFDVDEIKDAFRGNKEIASALLYYTEQDSWDDEEEYTDEYPNDDWDN